MELTPKRFAILLTITMMVAVCATLAIGIRKSVFTVKDYEGIALGMTEDEIVSWMGESRSYRYDFNTEVSVWATNEGPLVASEAGAFLCNPGSLLYLGCWESEEIRICVAFDHNNRAIAKTIRKMNPSKNEPDLARWIRRIRGLFIS